MKRIGRLEISEQFIEIVLNYSKVVLTHQMLQVIPQ